MTALSTVAFVVGVLGNIASAILFLSPIPTYVRIIKEKNTTDFSGLTYVITWLNCCLWLFYGARKSVVLIMTINGFGFVIETIYVLLFLVYASSRKERNKVAGLWLLEIAFAALFGPLVWKLVHHKNTQTTIYGVLCVILNICFCWAPLSVVKTVVKTKSVEFMPLPLTFMTALNCIFWVIYSLIKKNWFVFIPNIIGLVGGVVQMIMYFYYWKTPESREAAKNASPWPWKKAKESPSIEMQGSKNKLPV